jgi:nicotinamide-nucleotide amidase
VAGASAAFRGGIVAYAADLKETQLGVPAAVLNEVGTVHRNVALAMAAGVRRRLDVAVGVATTGVAGPDPVNGQSAGTVHIAVDTGARAAHRRLALAGDREQVREETVRQVLALLVSVLMEDHA